MEALASGHLGGAGLPVGTVAVGAVLCLDLPVEAELLDLGGIENAQWTERTVVVMLNNAFTGVEKFDLVFQRRDEAENRNAD